MVLRPAPYHNSNTFVNTILSVMIVIPRDPCSQHTTLAESDLHLVFPVVFLNV